MTITQTQRFQKLKTGITSVLILLVALYTLLAVTIPDLPFADGGAIAAAAWRRGWTPPKRPVSNSCPSAAASARARCTHG